MTKNKDIWEFILDPEKVEQLSLADLLALETYIGRTGDGNTGNARTVSKIILTKINQLE